MKPARLPELKRGRWLFGETKSATVLRREYQRAGGCESEHLSSVQQSADRCTRGGQGMSLQKELEEAEGARNKACSHQPDGRDS